MARPDEIGGAELLNLPDVLGFAGRPTRAVYVADMKQQYAEKMHALTRSYATGESTRVRDLLDLVLLLEDGVPAGPELVARVRHVFAIRRTHPIPDELPEPPTAWEEPYRALAEEIGHDVKSHVDAHGIVATHWRELGISSAAGRDVFAAQVVGPEADPL